MRRLDIDGRRKGADAFHVKQQQILLLKNIEKYGTIERMKKENDKMKQILTLILTLAIVLSFMVSCGKSAGSETQAVETEPIVTEPIVTEPITESETEAEPPAPIKPVFNKPTITAELKKEYRQYLTSYWLDKINTVKTAQGSDFTFLVQTDPHFYVGSDEAVGNIGKAFSHFVDLDFVAVLGDLIRGYAYDEDNPDDSNKSFEELVRRYTENINCPILMTLGNHDTNAMWCKKFADHTQLINQYDHYFVMTEKLAEVNGTTMTVSDHKNYYYVDLPNYNVRVIMLNTVDDDYTEGYGSTFFISNEQKAWFKNEALKTKRSVIVMSHTALVTGISESGNNKVEGAGTILRAVEDFVAAGGDFVAYFCGHVHEQSHLVDNNGRLHISFKNGGGNGEVVFVNFEERTIRTVGLGKNVTDRTFTYSE